MLCLAGLLAGPFAGLLAGLLAGVFAGLLASLPAGLLAGLFGLLPHLSACSHALCSCSVRLLAVLA